jgi:hypothetical protein
MVAQELRPHRVAAQELWSWRVVVLWGARESTLVCRRNAG